MEWFEPLLQEERRCVMAANFRIIVHQNSDNLHLRLDGDFDESSARVLLDMIRKRCPFASRAFIHTNGLGRIDSFGSSVFRTRLGELKHCKYMRLRFTGDNAEALRSAGS
jgi:ABC-type transporter Mla MlaB component